MVNNTAQDGTPYFLSANHCGTTGVDTWVFVFNYDSPACGGGDGNLNQSISGSTLRANNTNSDFVLLELSVPPPPNYVVYYAGWNRATIPSPNSVCIHHPAGDVKKITFNTDPLIDDANDNYWQVTEWENGTTEGGSSGSPLFDSNKRIVGQLFGGSASCTSITEDIYGKFDRSWDAGASSNSRLKEWLDPAGTGATFLDGAYFIEPPLAYNMEMQTINSPNTTTPVCITNPAAEITVRNIGGNDVTAFNIVYSYDGEANQTYNWTGTLGFYQSTTITLPAQNLSVGTHSLVATVAMPNGNEDLDTSNDMLSIDFDIIDGHTATMNLTTDQFPTETTITILDEAGNVVYVREDFAGTSLNTEDFCLEDGCYRFVINDSYGDGLLDDANLEFIVNGESIGQISGGFTSDTLYACLPLNLQAKFFIPNQSYCVGESIIPDNISQRAVAWAWIIPNSSIETSTEENPIFSYDTPGLYSISLTVVDEVGNNDTFSTTISIIDGDLLTINLLTDRWPDENSYQILDSEGGVVFSVNDFSDADRNTNLIENICLEDGCYTVVFTDSYGDGLSGSSTSPTGSFTVSIGEEIIGFAEGDFGSTYEIDFCLPLNVNTNDIPLAKEVSLFPNPTQGFLQIKSPTLPLHIEVRDVLGRLMSTSNLPSSYTLNINHVDAGVYFVKMTFEEGIVTKKVVKR